MDQWSRQADAAYERQCAAGDNRNEEFQQYIADAESGEDPDWTQWGDAPELLFRLRAIVYDPKRHNAEIVTDARALLRTAIEAAATAHCDVMERRGEFDD